MSNQGKLSESSSPLPDIETLTGDVGAPVGPDGSFNVDIVGGTNISTAGVPASNRIVITSTGDAFVDAIFRIENDPDGTKKIAFDGSNITTATTRTYTAVDGDGSLGSFTVTPGAPLTTITPTPANVILDLSGSNIFYCGVYQNPLVDQTFFRTHDDVTQISYSTTSVILGSGATSTLINGTLNLPNEAVDGGILHTDASGNVTSQTNLASDTTAVTQAPADASTKVATTAYVDTAVTAEDFWDRATGTPNYLIPNTAADDIGAIAARITKGWFTELDATTLVRTAEVTVIGVLGLTGSTGILANIGTGQHIIRINTAPGAGVEYVEKYRHDSSIPGVGIGVGVEYELDTTDGLMVLGSNEVIATDVASGTEDADFVIKLSAAGAAPAEKLRVASDGDLTVTGDVTATGLNTIATVDQTTRNTMDKAGINNQTGTSYVVTASDMGKKIKLTNGSAITLTLPQVSTEDLEVGFQCFIEQGGVGQVSVAVQGAEVLNSADSLVKLRTLYSGAWIVKEADALYYMSGDLTV